MTTDAIAIRSAKPSDARGLARVHDDAWRFAYRGVLPGAELERMIARRGPQWWAEAVRRGVPILVLEGAGEVRGYVTYGASRMRTLPYRAEIYELYIQPEYTGLGFGRRLFDAVQARLSRRGHRAIVVWCLANNDAGCRFYEGLGGQIVSRASERLSSASVEKVAFAFEYAPSADRTRP